MSTIGIVVLIVLFTVASLIFIKVAAMPGKTAIERGHPHAEAINTLGWLGLPLGVIPWLVAMVWARMQPPHASASTASNNKKNRDEKGANGKTG